MKIKQIEQISDTEVNVTWEKGEVQNLQGQSAVTLLQMTEMKVGEKYNVSINNDYYCPNVTIVNITDSFIEYSDKPNSGIAPGTLFYEDCAKLVFEKVSDKPTTTAKERVETELDELSLKCRKLENFVISPKFTTLGYAQQYLLENQLGAMLDYEKCLKARLDCWDK